MKKTLLLHTALLLPTVFVFWLAAYPETMRWMEGISYFSTLPDFLHLQVRYPSEALKYAGAFLLQFYRWPAAGALLQTLMAWIVLMCADAVAFRLLRRERLMWTAFVPAAVFVALQCGYRDLEGSLAWCLASVMTAAAVSGLAWRHGTPIMKGGKASGDGTAGSLAMQAIIPLALLAAGMAVSLADREYRVRERIHETERMADTGRWDDILERVTPEVSAADPVRRRYALLALSAKGRLAEEMFRYGAEDADDLFFAYGNDAISCFFNALLAENLGLDNESIHQMFQLNSLAPLGTSFRSLRHITDACLRQGYTTLAEKYLRVLSHSTCHGGWVRDRVNGLRRAKSDADERADDAILTCAHNDLPLLTDMACLFDAQPGNRMCGDMLLCGLLATRDTERFAQLFPHVMRTAYPQAGAGRLPRHYEEALLLLSRQYPELLHRYSINPLRAKEFEKFAKLMDAGRRDEACAMYPGSFWAYMYSRQ